MNNNLITNMYNNIITNMYNSLITNMYNHEIKLTEVPKELKLIGKVNLDIFGIYELVSEKINSKNVWINKNNYKLSYKQVTNDWCITNDRNDYFVIIDKDNISKSSPYLIDSPQVWVKDNYYPIIVESNIYNIIYIIYIIMILKYVLVNKLKINNYLLIGGSSLNPDIFYNESTKIHITMDEYNKLIADNIIKNKISDNKTTLNRSDVYRPISVIQHFNRKDDKPLDGKMIYYFMLKPTVMENLKNIINNLIMKSLVLPIKSVKKHIVEKQQEQRDESKNDIWYGGSQDKYIFDDDYKSTTAEYDNITFLDAITRQVKQPHTHHDWLYNDIDQLLKEKDTTPLNFLIIGAGPTGLYHAKMLLNEFPKEIASIIIFDKRIGQTDNTIEYKRDQMIYYQQLANSSTSMIKDIEYSLMKPLHDEGNVFFLFQDIDISDKNILYNILTKLRIQIVFDATGGRLNIRNQKNDELTKINTELDKMQQSIIGRYRYGYKDEFNYLSIYLRRLTLTPSFINANIHYLYTLLKNSSFTEFNNFIRKKQISQQFPDENFDITKNLLTLTFDQSKLWESKSYVSEYDCCSIHEIQSYKYCKIDIGTTFFATAISAGLTLHTFKKLDEIIINQLKSYLLSI